MCESAARGPTGNEGVKGWRVSLDAWAMSNKCEGYIVQYPPASLRKVTRPTTRES